MSTGRPVKTVVEETFHKGPCRWWGSGSDVSSVTGHKKKGQRETVLRIINYLIKVKLQRVSSDTL